MDRQENPNDRNPALDFTKGVLVLFMILYHWINYFVGVEGPVYTYLRFIPPSFIFIAGFLLANIYPTKYGFSDSNLYMRLIVRGLKLLVLFTLLNVIANVLFERSYRGAMPGIEAFVGSAAVIFTSGNARASFEILVPIGYLLILSAGVFLAMQVHKYSIHLICAASFLCVSLLESHESPSPNLSLIAIGLLGMVFGLYPIQKTNNLAEYPIVVWCLNVGYVLAISIFEVSYYLQVIGVCLSVLFIYIVGVRISKYSKLRGTIILLGKYSLFGYIVQIAVLQLLQRSLPLLNMNNLAVWILSFFGAFILTLLIVKIAHYIRAKSHVADWMYRVVFS